MYTNAKCTGQLPVTVISAMTHSKVFVATSPLPYTINLISSSLGRKYFIPDSLLFSKQFSP
jgi:hypothetical protein